MQWYLGALRKYADFDGRARRTEYWMFHLFNVIVAAVLVILTFVSGTYVFFVVCLVYWAAVMIPSLAIFVRRLHDQDRSGGWFFVGFVPVVGTIWLLVLMCMAGTVGSNRFGSDPKASLVPAYQP